VHTLQVGERHLLGCEASSSGLIFNHYRIICLKKWGKSKKNLTQDYRGPGRDLSLALAEYKAEAVELDPTFSL
jgi:hypothetical protein